MEIERWIEAFKAKYEHDDYDDMCFKNAELRKRIRDRVEDYDGAFQDKDKMADEIYEIVYLFEYGNTSDADDLNAISIDIRKRFPEGRIKK